MASGQLVAVVVHVVREGNVLAMRRSQHKTAAGLWETVSGRVEPSEQPLVCAKREVLEETGLHVSVEERPLDAYAAMRGSEPMVVIVYRAHHVSGEPALSAEHDALRWCSAQELAELGSPARLVESVRRALSSK